MFYLDANVFIFAQISQENEGLSARMTLKAMEEGKIKAITNILAVDEVVWKIKREVDYPLAIKVGRAMFELSNLDIVEVTPKIVREAFNFMEKYQLRPRDAIHVSSMLENEVSTIITEDPDFKKAKEIKVLTLSEFLKKLK